MTSIGGKLTALACHPTKYVNKAEVTNPYISKGTKIDCLSFVYVPATSAAHNRLLFFLFLLWPFTALMKKTSAVKQSIFLDVYEPTYLSTNIV